MFSSEPCVVGGSSTGSCSSVATDADEVAIFVLAFFVGGSHGGSKESDSFDTVGKEDSGEE